MILMRIPHIVNEDNLFAEKPKSHKGYNDNFLIPL